MRNAIELIRTRKSVRTFDGRALDPDHLQRLKDFAARVDNPYGIPLEFRFLSAREHGLVCPVAVGTDHYVGAKMAKGPYMEEAFGYSFEMFVLYAQSLGVGTVWLGGTMEREGFERAMELGEEERMPCASPLGYAAQKRAPKDIAFRLALKGDERVPFEKLFFRGGFDTPLTADAAGDLANALEAVRWAPTAANRQPIRAVVTDDAVHFYVRHSKGFIGDRAGDMQKIDVGIGLCHFELAARELGWKVTFSLADPGIAHPDHTDYVASWLLTR